MCDGVVVGDGPRVAELALGSVSLVTLLSFCFLALSTLYISLARTPTHRDKKHSYSKKKPALEREREREKKNTHTQKWNSKIENEQEPRL